MTTRIQPLRAEHAAQYRALTLQSYEHEPEAFTSTPPERAGFPLSWWEQRIGGPGQPAIAFGAFDGEQLVGAVALEFSPRPKTMHKAHLIGMYVQPAARGKGLGRQLVELALNHARQHPGIEVVTLTVTEGNGPAIALYEAVGFRSFGIEPMAIRTSAGYKAKVHMWQPINPADDGRLTRT